MLHARAVRAGARRRARRGLRTLQHPRPRQPARGRAPAGVRGDRRAPFSGLDHGSGQRRRGEPRAAAQILGEGGARSLPRARQGDNGVADGARQIRRHHQPRPLRPKKWRAGPMTRRAVQIGFPRASVHAGDLEFIAHGVPDGSLAAVGERDRRAVCCMQREQVDAVRQLDGREHGPRLVRIQGLDVGDLAASELGQVSHAHDRRC